MLQCIPMITVDSPIHGIQAVLLQSEFSGLLHSNAGSSILNLLWLMPRQYLPETRQAAFFYKL